MENYSTSERTAAEVLCSRFVPVEESRKGVDKDSLNSFIYSVHQSIIFSSQQMNWFGYEVVLPNDQRVPMHNFDFETFRKLFFQFVNAFMLRPCTYVDALIQHGNVLNSILMPCAMATMLQTPIRLTYSRAETHVSPDNVIVSVISPMTLFWREYEWLNPTFEFPYRINRMSKRAELNVLTIVFFKERYAVQEEKESDNPMQSIK